MNLIFKSCLNKCCIQSNKAAFALLFSLVLIFSSNISNAQNAKPEWERNQIITPEKSPVIAFACSLVIPGMGQIYNEDIGEGLFLFFGATGCFFVDYYIGDETNGYFLIAYALLHSYSIIEAPLRAQSITKEYRYKKMLYGGFFQYDFEDYSLCLSPGIDRQQNPCLSMSLHF